MNRIKTAFLAVAFLGALAVALFLWKYGEWVAIPRARASMVALLKDPSSAQTRNERITKEGVLCGEVNAKNGMGGYVGFKKYISYGPQSNYVEGAGLLSETSTDEFIARMDVKIKLLEMYNKWREEGVHVPQYSESDLEQRTTNRIFEDKWDESCSSQTA